MWPRPPRAVIRPQTSPRTHGRPRPVRLPSSDRASAKPMLMPAPRLAARPTRKVSQLFLRGERRGEQRRQRRNRAVHQAGQARLHDLQHEQSRLRRRLFLVRRRRRGRFQFLGDALVLAFLLGQVAQQLADAGVGRRAGGASRRTARVSSSINSACLRTASRPSGRTSQTGLR